MSIIHLSILKANENELKAIRNLDNTIPEKLALLFEVDPPSENVRTRKYMRASESPIMTYIDRKIAEISNHWFKQPAMIDGFRWEHDARVENGEHVIPYMVSRLVAGGNLVTPVVGYDRWGSIEYKIGLKNISKAHIHGWCLRLDATAIEDSAEPEFFQENIRDIVDELGIDPRQCRVILDFADVSLTTNSVSDIFEKSCRVIRQLTGFCFDYYSVCGCSLPSSIEKAVEKKDTNGSVLRKEMLVYQMLRSEFPYGVIKSGDYGVRGPTTTEHQSKHINGKIRYTTELNFFVVRGHSIQQDGGTFAQMHGLAENLVGSEHFLGENFSWGDKNIVSCSKREKLKGKAKPGNAGTWVGFDTNHHLTFVVQEIEEFERKLKVRELVGSEP
ncbi:MULTISPECIES: beta family protein [Asaia]|uniref:beta family protein n=1 Tax=Asaia TaxID=91914 RepID=UPI002FC38FE6